MTMVFRILRETLFVVINEVNAMIGQNDVHHLVKVHRMVFVDVGSDEKVHWVAQQDLLTHVAVGLNLTEYRFSHLDLLSYVLLGFISCRLSRWFTSSVSSFRLLFFFLRLLILNE